MEKVIFSAKKKKGETRVNKEWIICFVIVLAVIITDLATQNYTQNSVETLGDKLQILKEELGKEEVDKDNVKMQIEDIKKEWKEKYEKLAYFIEHDELEKVETELTSLEAHVDIEEYDHAVPELEKGEFILNHIKDKFKLDIKNIF